MKLSVVVPFYNVELYLHDCLASLAGQTLANLEVVLVDDGSLDGSREIATQFVDADARFRMLTQENQGLGPARNTGMRAARGEYLTFVDSDDVVPTTALEAMVRRLDRTGSDFAAGNARRFNLTGVTGSWTHRQAFAEDVRQTSIRHLPALADDRMVWNKVYRRTFWEAGGHEFPAIMYEDYPVTLRAHLEAASVEVLAMPVYYWRQRDAGEASITQRVYEARNVDDRVASARMVLDVLAAADGVPDEVRHRVQANLVTTDIQAVARAVAHPDNTPHVEDVLAAAQQLVAAIDPPVLAGRRPLEKVMYELVRRGDVDDLRALFDVRDRVSPPAGHERDGVLRRRRLITLPGRDLSALPDQVRRLGPDKLDLAARVRSLRWDGARQVLGLEAWVHFSGPLRRPALSAWLQRAGTGERLPLEVGPISLEGAHVRAEAVFDAAAIAAHGAPGPQRWALHVRLQDAGLDRTAVAESTGGRADGAGGTAAASSPWIADDWTWVQSGRSHGEFVVRRLVWPAHVDTVSDQQAGELALAGAVRDPLPARDAALELSTSDGQRWVLPVVTDSRDPRRWSAHIQLDMLAPEFPDRYVDEVTSWELHLLAGERREPVGYSPQLASVRARHHGREVQLLGNLFHRARIDTMWPRFVIEEGVALEDGRTVLGGRWPEGPLADVAVVLRWYDRAGTPVDVRPPVRVDRARFSFEVDPAQLGARLAAAREEDPLDAGIGSAWQLHLEHDGRLSAGYLLGGLERSLPGQPWHTPDGDLRLTGGQQAAARFELTDLAKGASASAT